MQTKRTGSEKKESIFIPSRDGRLTQRTLYALFNLCCSFQSFLFLAFSDAFGATLTDSFTNTVEGSSHCQNSTIFSFYTKLFSFVNQFNNGTLNIRHDSVTMDSETDDSGEEANVRVRKLIQNDQTMRTL